MYIIVLKRLDTAGVEYIYIYIRIHGYKTYNRRLFYTVRHTHCI